MPSIVLALLDIMYAWGNPSSPVDPYVCTWHLAVTMPAYSDNRLYALFFILFLVVGKLEQSTCVLGCPRFQDNIYLFEINRLSASKSTTQVFCLQYAGLLCLMNMLTAVIYNQFRGYFSVSNWQIRLFWWVFFFFLEAWSIFSTVSFSWSTASLSDKG